MEQKKEILLQNLKNINGFWSFNKENINSIPDELLIENVLLYLDIDEIRLLFQIFPSEKIKETWLKKKVSQEPYYHELNKFYSWFLFDIENYNTFLIEYKNERINS